MIITRKMCMTKDVGCNGNLFGGNMMAWIDEAAAIYACIHTGEQRMVTLKFSELLFKKAIKVGDIIEFSCENTKVGHSSISFRVDATRRCGDSSELVCSTDCTFVAVGEDGTILNLMIIFYLQEQMVYILMIPIPKYGKMVLVI